MSTTAQPTMTHIFSSIGGSREISCARLRLNPLAACEHLDPGDRVNLPERGSELSNLFRVLVVEQQSPGQPKSHPLAHERTEVRNRQPGFAARQLGTLTFWSVFGWHSSGRRELDVLPCGVEVAGATSA